MPRDTNGKKMHHLQQITFCAATLALIKSWELGIDRTQGSALRMIRAGLRERDRVPAVMQHMLSQQLHFLSWILWLSVLPLRYCTKYCTYSANVDMTHWAACRALKFTRVNMSTGESRVPSGSSTVGGLLSACSVRVCERNVTKSANLGAL